MVCLLAAGTTASAIALLVLGSPTIFVADHFVRPKFMTSGTRLLLVLVAVRRELALPGAR